jgi:hypothetical protein
MIDWFCHVPAVCYQGEPNWLGWIVLTLPALFVVGVIIDIKNGH